MDGMHANPQPFLMKSEGFIWPADGGEIAASVNTYPGHTGIDIPLPEGAPVYAAASGTVTVAREGMIGYGNYMIIDHGNGYTTLYAHNSALHSKVGDEVTGPSDRCCRPQWPCNRLPTAF